MYKITWDKETGGVLLHSRIVEGTLGISPRPVFFEELDLLGLDKLGWTYPHVEEPIMWAVNKAMGKEIFKTKYVNTINAYVKRNPKITVKELLKDEDYSPIEALHKD